VAIFAFVEAALLKPLSYSKPARLVGVFETVPMFPQSNLSYLDYLDWKRLKQRFQFARRLPAQRRHPEYGRRPAAGLLCTRERRLL